MINIVVLMAGEGLRFKNQGYKIAKPFIKINDKMMIEHVLDGAKINNAKYILVIRESFLVDYNQQLEHLKQNYNIKFSCVQKTTKGALCTALSVYDKLESSKPVIFIDSDNIFDNTTFNNFTTSSIYNRYNGNLLTFKSNDDRFSYAKVDKNNLVIQTAEKQLISDNAIAGAYMFSSGKTFIDTAIKTIIYPNESSNEYYISFAYNTLYKLGKKIGIYNIDKNKFNCVGTPEQLKIFNELCYYPK